MHDPTQYEPWCMILDVHWLSFFFFALKSIKKLIKKLQSIVLFFFKPLLTITKDEKKK